MNKVSEVRISEIMKWIVCYPLFLCNSSAMASYRDEVCLHEWCGQNGYLFVAIIHNTFHEKHSWGIENKQPGFMEVSVISELMINEQIRDREVRVIGTNGEQLGIMSSKEAQKLAEQAELDLVKIVPKAQPPVCKIIDYGKYKYELARKEKEARKKQRTVDVKEVRLSPNIEENDLNTKVNAARKFLSKGDKVKVSLRFRGREMAHVASSKHILDDFAEKLSDIAVIEKAPKMEGRSMTMFLAEKR